MGNGILIGLGTGRCGTTSLAHILNSAEGCEITHETSAARLALSWKFSEEGIKKILKGFQSSGARVSGDVAFFYLPYVEWVAKEAPETTFICLKRNREETIESYMKKTMHRDHWSRKCTNSDPWDRLYPKFETDDKREAIGMYWDMYYAEATRLEKSGVRIKTFDMNLMNTKEGVKEILEFCGLDSASARVGVKRNSL